MKQPFGDQLLTLALGDLCIIVSSTENLIRKFIHHLISHEDETILEIITGNMQFIPLCKLAINLYDYKTSRRDDKKEFKKLIRKVQNVYVKRSELIHSDWFVTSPDHIRRIKQSMSYNVTINDVYSLIKEFKTYNSRLLLFVYNLHKKHPSKSHEKALAMFETMIKSQSSLGEKPSSN